MHENSGQSGRPFEVTHAMVLHLAVPMVLTYISTPLLGLIDTAIAGQFPDPSLIGGLAIGAIIVDLVFTSFNFLRSGTTGLASQAFGSNNEKEKQAILFRALAIATGAGLVAIAASPVILETGLWLMAPGQAVSEATSAYFLIRILSAPFTLGNYVILGWLLGLGKSGWALAVQLLLNGANIVLSISLGLWLGWGIEGIAIATIASEVLAFAAGIVICWHLADHARRPSWFEILSTPHWKQLANLNLDIMIRSFALLTAFALFTAHGAKFGEITLAANAVLMHFFFIAGYFLDGLASAAEQIVGRSVGARYREGFEQGVRLTLIWNIAMALVCSIIFLGTGNQLIELMTINAQVRQEALLYLPWAALVPLSGVLAFQMDGIFIGATWTRDMSIMMIFSLFVYMAILWSDLGPQGNHGLWFALHGFVVIRGVTLLLRLKPCMHKTFPVDRD